MRIFSFSRFCLLSVMWSCGASMRRKKAETIGEVGEGGPRIEKQEDSLENFHPKTFTKEA